MNTRFIGATVQGVQVAMRVRAANHWLVRSGTKVIGPVSLELLERGLEAGKIPSDSEMALLGGNQWRQVAEIFPTAPPPQRPTPLASPAVAPWPVPPAPPSMHYPDEPVNIPKQGVMASLFS
ncbi:MAG: hypothetical protein DRI90_01940 [Deltaproteobacteria bacterium]|nr:MAG: hypothetical protein DRI90_01940 [Deltaproteobacteria bacterium]